jgi:predicted ferric reductase
MDTPARAAPWWAALTVWGVVNSVNVLQAAGFASRVLTGSRDVNRALGLAIAVLAIPAALALAAFVREGTGARHRLGPASFLVFVAFMIAVEHVWPVEFRSPARPAILVPYLVLFFGSIFLMGVPMFRMNRRLWLVTAVTTVLLLAAMMVAIAAGVG